MARGTGFIFVNKTPESTHLSHSEGEERRRILSHVQQPAQPPRGTFVVVTEEALNIHRRSRRKPRSYGHPGTNLIRCGVSPTLTYVESRFDPFESFATRMSLDMQHMFTYYHKTVVDQVGIGQCMIDDTKRYLTRWSASNPAVLYVVLSIANVLFSVACGEMRYQHDAEQYRHRTIVHIRKDVSKQRVVNVSTIYAVSLLLRLECGIGDLDTARIHYEGLMRMIDMLNSLSHIPRSMLISIQSCLFTCSAVLEVEPPIIIPDCMTLILPPSVQQRMLEDRASQEHLSPMTMFRFDAPPYRKLVGDELYDIVAQRRKITSIKKLTGFGNDDVGLLPRDYELLHIAHLSFDYRLLSMPCQDPNTHHLNPIRNAVRLALYVQYSPSIPINQPHNAFRTSLARQLKQALSDSNVDNLWLPCTDLLLAVLFIAGLVSQQQCEWPWVIARAAYVCGKLGIDSLAAFEDILSGFEVPLHKYSGLPEMMWNCIDLIE